MSYGGCQNPEGCEIIPIPLGQWPAIHWDDDVPEKAVSFPLIRHICADREIWNAGTPQMRIWMYLHELAHCEGAECEPCADFRAGEHLQQSGWDAINPDDGEAFLEEIADTLQFRSPADAQRAFSDGYAGRGLDTSGLPTDSATFYVAGAPSPAPDGTGTIVEIRTGVWVDMACAADWDALFTAASNAGIIWTVNSSYRTHDEQVDQWNQRHTQTWAENPSASAPLNAAAATLGPAALPDYSEHQSGHAVDLSFSSDGDRTAFATLAEANHIYRNAPTEQWHFAWIDPAVHPEGRRKYPIDGIAQIPGNVVAGGRTLDDAASGADAGTETNPPGAYVATAPAVSFPMLLILALVAWWGYRDADR